MYHLEDNGFSLSDHVVNDMTSVKMENGIPHRLGSCHTAVIDGKFVEGHVPAADILKLRAQPDPIGAAVPGMPIGSPGMEMGERKDAFKVIGVSKARSEEHTSELQSLMRTSYAVFCLKNNTHQCQPLNPYSYTSYH